MRQLFDFPDKLLGPHIERALHAMSLNEDREDFVSPLSISFLRFRLINISCLASDKVLSDQEREGARSTVASGENL